MRRPCNDIIASFRKMQKAYKMMAQQEAGMGKIRSGAVPGADSAGNRLFGTNASDHPRSDNDRSVNEWRAPCRDDAVEAR